ncbi:hypothetical protein NM688_g7331 [Phlebia brevispora]|uniref:Uncharacterized protein n=1 Tax=Phlebia brevispora TaxID=194682 RepID=A0ACC1S701_9APHY|nr:hypothetical protein NM688_g7331 [Phlebia brevispora]
MSTTAVPPLTKLPSTSTFSFTAPFPPPSDTSANPALSPHKQQRRVSLALPSSPRQFPAWSFRDDMSVGVGAASPSGLVPEKKGKMRRIANDDDDLITASTSARPLGSFKTSQTAGTSTAVAGETSKKQRRKWTDEETQMLVDGCQKWGVGNWKAILNDPELKFDNRSPVDLKDR